jgi:predicted GIY-YIG superfamily endonuclease
MKIEPHPWHEIGEVGLGPDGKLLMPEPGHGPGIYRFRLTSGESPSVYIGESEDMSRRFRQYRNPERSQRTNVRLNARLKVHIEAGGAAQVAVVTEAVLIVAECHEPLDLGRRTSRLLVEGHLLDLAREAGTATVENVS